MIDFMSLTEGEMSRKQVLAEEPRVMPRKKQRAQWTCHGKLGDGRFNCSYNTRKEIKKCPKCGGQMKLA